MNSSLVNDMAIIVERPRSPSSSSWKIAKVEKYDETTGGHTVRYATGWKRGKERSVVHLDSICVDIFPFTFDTEALIILAAREYYIIRRTASNHSSPVVALSMSDKDTSAPISDSSRLVQAIGSRVESSCCGESSWKVLTLAGIDSEASKAVTDGMRFILVADDGEVFTGVPAEQIRARGSIVREESSIQARSGRLSGDDRNTLFPYLAIRERIEFARSSGERMSATSDTHNQNKALKRTWSALSLKDEMSSVDLKVSIPGKLNHEDDCINYVTMDCKLEESTFQFVALLPMLEQPPRICVQFSTHEKLPTLDLLSTPDTTLISALHQLHQKQKKWTDWPPKPICRLFFSLELKFFHSLGMKYKQSQVVLGDSLTSVKNEDTSTFLDSGSRCRKLSASLSPKDEEINTAIVTSLCDGIDEICVQCMEVICLVSECAKDPASPSDREILNLPGFANQSLSSKLLLQLNQSMFCVGAALPDWCLKAAAFAPHMFTYETRRMLLERTAFGPSRSTMCQQETKVNVGKLRQRMASLRARAVELVGEAFAGGAEDPTALQLQADELYGMEEALASRVKAAFRAAKWQEHALQVAKAAVRRDRLLSDASSIMDKYTNDRTVCRRRLEVRFEGESGFDAASGDEAGVTRGFYADVAEALISLDIVAGVRCSSQCLLPEVSMSDTAVTDQAHFGSHIGEAHKLPLWIPDIDSNMQVIIPTPRAAKGSCLGIFPRPIPKYHPQFDSVMKMFRLMGRLFAAALRDGFMFPVPISAAFLKLVQHGSSIRQDVENGHAPLLASDLPRPGFLGGEVYAADYYVCRALDRLDAMDPPLSRHDLKRAYEDISTDPNFARVALGKSYDCSFEEYFQDRTFVDPIDPAQDAEAAPLCHKGYTKSITIYNVREWVTLAKNFMLYDGVFEQAMAFRRGVDDFFSSDYLCVFTSDELQRDVFGVGDDVDNWNESSIRKLFKLDGTLNVFLFLVHFHWACN
jgi:HECT-domain (ubiquitin-transferase)